MVYERTVATAPCAESRREHLEHRIEVLALKTPVRIGAPDELKQCLLVPFLCGDFRGDLLREHIERIAGDVQLVELAAAHRIEERRALHEIIARQRKDPALRGAAHRVAGAPDALQEGVDGARRAQLAHEVNIADVDAQLE